jgi:integrase
VLSDLDDDALTAWMKSLIVENRLSVMTIREKIGRVLSLWTFLAKRGIVPTFPTVTRPPAPEIIPTALSEAELKRLFDAAGDMGGRIAGVRARDWWQALFGFIWSSGERKGAALALRWEWVDEARRLIIVPPAVRKGRVKTGIYSLWPEVAELLYRIRKPTRELVFPWEKCQGTYWNDYGKILRLAGLPDDSKHKTKSLRVSHATWLKVMGGDPTQALMHGDSATTIKHYLDPRMMPQEKRRLFVPWESQPELQAPKKPKVKHVVVKEPELPPEAWL